MVRMEVVGVAPEPNSNKPIVWLKDKEQKVFLPISIGNFEATAIYMELYNEPPPRPICYDLVKTVLGQVNAEVERILISELKEDTFFAEITLRNGDQEFVVDSRPSDAIALALRLKTTIYAADSVLDEAGLEVKGEDSPAIWEDDIDAITDLQQVADLPVQPVDEPGSRLSDLQKRLEEAVSQEEYEKAAEIRDEMGRLDSA